VRIFDTPLRKQKPIVRVGARTKKRRRAQKRERHGWNGSEGMMTCSSSWDLKQSTLSIRWQFSRTLQYTNDDKQMPLVMGDKAKGKEGRGSKGGKVFRK
jgi:hypothetical protein